MDRLLGAWPCPAQATDTLSISCRSVPGPPLAQGPAAPCAPFLRGSQFGGFGFAAALPVLWNGFERGNDPFLQV